jgi:hypothetical protein
VVIFAPTDVGTGIQDAHFRWRLGNSPDSDTGRAPFDVNQSEGKWSVKLRENVLSEETLKETGWEIRAFVSDRAGKSAVSDWCGVPGVFDNLYYERTQAEWLGLKSGDDGTDSLWHLVSIPGRLSDNLVSTVFTALSGLPSFTGTDLGDDWRIVDGRSNPLSRTGDALNPGEAYWFRHIDQQFTLSLPSGITLPTNAPFEIEIDTGWNLISNPYFFPVWVSSDLLDPSAVNSPYRQKSGAEPNGVDWWESMDLSNDSLEPWKGYILYAESPSTVYLDPHYRPSDAQPQPALGDWTLAITAGSGTGLVGTVAIGACTSCQDGPDFGDVRPMPFFGAAPKVVSRKPECGTFIRDVRASGGLQKWQLDFELKGADNLSLTWARFTPPEMGKALVLRDLGTDGVVDMAETSTYQVPDPAHLPQGRFQVYYGDVDQVKQAASGAFESRPAAHQLHQNYPNPFNPSTTIYLDLPKAGQVQLEVFNILGAKVTTLLDDYLLPGSHSVSWDGRDASGKGVSSGVYFVRMVIGDFRSTIKLSLIK